MHFTFWTIMVIIIHGDDTVSSRKYFLEQKQKSNNPLSFDGKSLTLTDLIQAFEGGSLFNDDKSIFIEDFFSTRKPSKELEEIVSYVQKINTGDIFFWEGKEITKKTASLIKNAATKPFNLPKNIFQFLDSLKPKNSNAIVLFHDTIKNSDVEMIFFMMIRQFRLLLALSDDSSSEEIDEVKRLAPWQKSKLKKQAAYFSTHELKNIYHKLYEIDLAQKTGKLSLTLTQTIDFLLLEI